MALDWCILGQDGGPELIVAMEDPDHHFMLSRGGHQPLLSRAKNYYGDAEYQPDEVFSLLEEIVSIGPQTEVEAHLAALCGEALRRQCGISVLCD